MTRVARILNICRFVLPLLMAAGLSGQDQTGQTPAIFTSRTNLVLIPVVVEDGGKHVPGLTKDDFVDPREWQRKAGCSLRGGQYNLKSHDAHAEPSGSLHQ